MMFIVEYFALPPVSTMFATMRVDSNMNSMSATFIPSTLGSKFGGGRVGEQGGRSAVHLGEPSIERGMSQVATIEAGDGRHTVELQYVERVRRLFRCCLRVIHRDDGEGTETSRMLSNDLGELFVHPTCQRVRLCTFEERGRARPGED